MKNYGLFEQLVRLREFGSKRSSSWDRSGGNDDSVPIPPGESLTLLDREGAGCIKHIYWTYIVSNNVRNDAARLNLYRGLVLRAFWDGSARPSI